MTTEEGSTSKCWVRLHRLRFAPFALKPKMPVIGSMCVPVRKHAADFGYIVNPQYWNRGYATEASSAIMRWLESESGIQRIWATCDVDNLASARVLEKLGLVREGLLRRSTVRPNISELPRDAWMFAKVCGNEQETKDSMRCGSAGPELPALNTQDPNQ